MSDIVAYHPHNPDPLFDGCQATGENEDGVVFLAMEPAVGSMAFVGRTAIIEAAAALHGLTPNAVRKALEEAGKPAKSRRTTKKNPVVV